MSIVLMDFKKHTTTIGLFHIFDKMRLQESTMYLVDTCYGFISMSSSLRYFRKSLHDRTFLREILYYEMLIKTIKQILWTLKMKN